MIRPSAPRLAIVLIVLAVSFCADKVWGSVSASASVSVPAHRETTPGNVTRSEGTHLGQEFISAILVLEPVIRQGPLFARALRRQPQRLRHSALHEARPIVLPDFPSQVHGRRVHVLEPEQPRQSARIIARDYPQVFLLVSFFLSTPRYSLSSAMIR